MGFIVFLKVLCIIAIPLICIFLGFSALCIFAPDFLGQEFIEKYNPPEFLFEIKYFYIEIAALVGCIVLLIIFSVIIKAIKRKRKRDKEEYNRINDRIWREVREEHGRRKMAAQEVSDEYYGIYDAFGYEVADRYDFDYDLDIKGSPLGDDYKVLVIYTFYDQNHRQGCTVESLKREIRAEMRDRNPADIMLEVRLVSGYRK